MKPVTLKTPIKRGDKKIEDVIIRQPKGGELRGVSLAEFAELKTDVILTIIPRVSTPSITELEAAGLTAMDLMAIGAAMLGANEEKAGNDTIPKP